MSTALSQLKTGKVKKTGSVDLSEWGCGKLSIQELSGNERVDFAKRYKADANGMLDDDAGLQFFCEVAMAGVINDEGAKCLTADEAQTLRDNSVSALSAIANGILELSGVGKAAQVKAEKN